VTAGGQFHDVSSTVLPGIFDLLQILLRLGCVAISRRSASVSSEILVSMCTRQ